MNLYRIDLTGVQGQDMGAVSDFLGPCLIRSHASAKQRAIVAAKDRGCFAWITRISGAGQCKRMMVVTPDGAVRRLT